MKIEDLLIIIENINKTQLQPMTARKHFKATNYSEVVKKQLQVCSIEEVKKIIYKINDLELLVKKNSLNSFNFVADFVRNY